MCIRDRRWSPYIGVVLPAMHGYNGTVLDEIRNFQGARAGCPEMGTGQASPECTSHRGHVPTAGLDVAGHGRLQGQFCCRGLLLPDVNAGTFDLPTSQVPGAGCPEMRAGQASNLEVYQCHGQLQDDESWHDEQLMNMILIMDEVKGKQFVDDMTGQVLDLSLIHI